MKRILFFLLLIITAASCKNTWSQEDKKAFYEACTEDAANGGSTPEKIKPYCDCVLGKIMEKYPNGNDALEHMDSLAKDHGLISCKTQRDSQ